MRAADWTFEKRGVVRMRVTVRIYKTRRSMLRAAVRAGATVEHADTGALCFSNAGTPNWTGERPWAQLFFYEGNLTVDTLAHEVAHAMQTYTDALARGRRVSWGIRETVATASGLVVARLVSWAREGGA